ncbi:MAG: peptidyl-prolyl cis-trans isomerase [Phycisphaerae bacterium]|nr:peptidyl-prolyl cis-trans isomerase [Phycisphaerae bacterium]
MANTKVQMKTTMGDMIIELDTEAAPVTVKNFLEYVDNGFYAGTVFHRVIPGFMIQGGGMDKDLNPKSNNDPIVNEASNGLKNERGTLAMARTSDPDSATSQFFINHKDNDFLNYSGPSPDKIGYAVFARVTEGMDVVDAIAAVKTTRKGHYDDVPAEPVEIVSVKVL